MSINHINFNSLSLSSLPFEIQDCILSHLKNDFDNLIRLSSVCRAFYAIVINYERQLFPMYSWVRDSKKWGIVSHQKESEFKCIEYQFNKVFKRERYQFNKVFKRVRINKNISRYDYNKYLSSNFVCFDNARIEYRVYYSRSDDPYVFVSKLSKKYCQKIWRIPCIFNFINIHPFKGGFILVEEDGYEVYRWDKNGQLIFVRRRNPPGGPEAWIHSSVYLDKTLFIVAPPNSKKNRSNFFHYYVNPHDSKSKYILVDPKFSNYKKKKYYKKPHSLLKLGNDLYSDYCKKNRTRVLAPLRAKINDKNPKNNNKFFNSFNSENDEIFLDIPDAYKIENGMWTIFYSATQLCVFRKNQLWMKQEFYVPSNATLFLISNFLFICGRRHNFLVYYLPAKKDVTDLFSPLSQYLRNSKNKCDRLRSCVLQSSKSRIHVSAFIQQYQSKSKDNLRNTDRPSKKIVLFQFSISPDLTFNDAQEDFDEQFTAESEERKSDESKPEISLIENKKSSEQNNGSSVSQSSHSDHYEVKVNESEMDESEDKDKENSNSSLQFAVSATTSSAAANPQIPVLKSIVNEEQDNNTEDMLGADDDFEESPIYEIKGSADKGSKIQDSPATPSSLSVRKSAVSDEEAINTEDMLSTDDDFEEDSIYEINMGTDKARKTKEDAASQSIPPVSQKKAPSLASRTAKRITSETSQALSCNPYKVILVVSFIFVFGGLGGTAILVALHPGLLLFKVSVITITLPATITFGVTGIGGATAIATFIINKRKAATSKQIESQENPNYLRVD